MARPQCTVEGCPRDARGRGALCNMHDVRLRRNGDVGAASPKRIVHKGTHRQRTLSKTEILPDGCIRWTGAITQRGYATTTKATGGSTPAYRAVYEYLAGPIPPGLTLDHLCRNRWCVAPAHLEPVARGENVLRGDTLAARNKAKTHCLRGHALVEGNLESYERRQGRRVCSTCRREKRRRGHQAA